MPTFDFITAAPFRASLESDYAEMQRCAKAHAWKSAHVLAGSIVEALLIDYLAATITGSTGRPNKDPLRLDLTEAIAICKAERVLTERTADLSSVVRSYRNLIHPGRVVRLDEAPPSESSATIATSLVDLIIEEVAKVRRSTFGLTGEQIVSKLKRDPEALSILRHLLNDVAAEQRERLLVELLPDAYLTAYEFRDDLAWDASALLSRLAKAFRTVFESVDDSARARAVEHFVQILREGDGDLVRVYRDAFFEPGDLAFVADAQRPLVKEHLLSSTPPAHTADTAAYSAKLAPYLDGADVKAWLTPFLRALLSSSTSDDHKAEVRRALVESGSATPFAVDDALDQYLDGLAASFAARHQPAEAAVITALKEEIVADRLPF